MSSPRVYTRYLTFLLPLRDWCVSTVPSITVGRMKIAGGRFQPSATSSSSRNALFCVPCDINYLTLLWGLSLQLGHEERCVRLVQLSPCSTLSPTESKSERLSANTTSQNWSSVRARPCRVREGGKKREFPFFKSHLVLFIRVTSFQKVLREAARQGRGCREPRSVMKG